MHTCICRYACVCLSSPCGACYCCRSRGWGVYTCVDVRAHVYMGVSLSSQCLPVASRRWSVAVSLAYWIVAGLRFITTLGQRPLRPELPAKTTPWGNVVALLYSFMRRRQVGLLHRYMYDGCGLPSRTHTHARPRTHTHAHLHTHFVGVAGTGACGDRARRASCPLDQRLRPYLRSPAVAPGLCGVTEVSRGGHHVHLTNATALVSSLRPWLRASAG